MPQQYVRMSSVPNGANKAILIVIVDKDVQKVTYQCFEKFSDLIVSQISFARSRGKC